MFLCRCFSLAVLERRSKVKIVNNFMETSIDDNDYYAFSAAHIKEI